MNFRRLKSSVIYRHPREGRERAIDQWDLHQPKVYCALTSEKCTTGLAPSGMIQTQYKYHLALCIRPYTATANSNRPKKPPNTSRTDQTHALGPPTRTSMALRPPGRLAPTPRPPQGSSAGQADQYQRVKPLLSAQGPKRPACQMNECVQDRTR